MSTRVSMRLPSWRVALLAALAVSLSGAPLEAQSLGAVAREAEAKRKTVKSSGKVYTNDDLRSDPASVPAPPASEAGTAASPSSPSTGEGKDSTTDDGKDKEAAKGESYWRDRIKAEREALARAEAFATALQSQINGLYAEFTACQAPPQCNEISARRQQSLAELDRVKKEIDEHNKGIREIQDEARRAGVPAGWVR